MITIIVAAIIVAFAAGIVTGITAAVWSGEDARLEARARNAQDVISERYRARHALTVPRETTS